MEEKQATDLEKYYATCMIIKKKKPNLSYGNRRALKWKGLMDH